MNPINLRQEWARSLQDQRHRFVFNSRWELPIGDEDDPAKPQQENWILASLGIWKSLRLSRLRAGNSAASPILANIDFRVLKYFPFRKIARLDLVAEAFNLLNHPNIAQINPVFGIGSGPQPGFLQPIAGTGQRRVQFSDYEF